MIGCNSSGRASKIDVLMCPVMYLRGGYMASIIDHGDGPQYIYICFGLLGHVLKICLIDLPQGLALMMSVRNWP